MYLVEEWRDWVLAAVEEQQQRRGVGVRYTVEQCGVAAKQVAYTFRQPRTGLRRRRVPHRAVPPQGQR
jgi:hypothetical protein